MYSLSSFYRTYLLFLFWEQQFNTSGLWEKVWHLGKTERINGPSRHDFWPKRKP